MKTKTYTHTHTGTHTHTLTDKAIGAQPPPRTSPPEHIKLALTRFYTRFIVFSCFLCIFGAVFSLCSAFWVGWPNGRN